MADIDPIIEIRDRTRRIETRVTRYMEAQGFDTQVQKATWAKNCIVVPTVACSLKECLSAVPRDWDIDAEVAVYCGDELILSFFLPN